MTPRRVLSLAIVLLLASTARATDGTKCLHLVQLKPNERKAIAAVISNGGMYKSRVIEVAGRVRTADGTDRLAEVYLNHKDVFRWGSNSDIGSARGPLFHWRERLSFWGSGMAEVRVQAANTPTTLCLCTEDPEDRKGHYEARHKACMAEIRQ